MKYTLTLAHAPNEDVDGGYWRTPNAPPLAFVNVNTLLEAKELFEVWRDDNGLGSGNMTVVSGIVSTFPLGGFIGQFSYNGRLWDAPELSKDRNELSIAFMDKYSSDEVVPHYDDGSDSILKANPVLNSDGFEDKARKWNALLEQARALNLNEAEQVEFHQERNDIMKRLWTLKLTAHMCDNVHYLYKRESGRIYLTTKGGMCEALSNISENAAEFEMALEKSDTPEQAKATVKCHATYIKAAEAI